MSVDRNILSALMHRGRFRSLRAAVPSEMVDGNTVALLGWYELYFNQYPEHTVVDLDALLTLIQLRMQAGPDLMAQMRHLIGLLKTPVAPEILAGTVNQLEELRLSGETGALLMRYNAGEEIDLPYELQMLARDAKGRMERQGDSGWADHDILELLDDVADESGLQWECFPLLRQSLRGLRGGDNIAISAPTDKGKTSLLMLIAACMAKQAKVLFPDRPLLYLVNEGTAKKLTPRFYQTVLHSTLPELRAQAVENKLLPKYIHEVGRRDAVRFVDVHQKNVAQIARIIEAHNPYMVITDMTGRVRANANRSGGANDIGQLEDVWNSMRELAAMLDFIHLGTVQVSAEGFNMLYPPLSAMQNSKTGIQTTLDLCVMMGALQSSDAQFLRGISTPKNKMARTGKSSLTQFECNFKPERNIWE